MCISQCKCADVERDTADCCQLEFSSLLVTLVVPLYYMLSVIEIIALLLLPGMRDGQQIRFAAEGDQEPGIEPGDIIVMLDEQKHPVFKRRGNDLFLDFEIDLVDALCGFQKTIETLDKRTLLITSLPGALRFAVIVSMILS